MFIPAQFLAFGFAAAVVGAASPGFVKYVVAVKIPLTVLPGRKV